MIRLAALVLLLTGAPLWAEGYPARHAVTGVADDDVLNIRAAPEADAAIIGTLPPDATGVEVVAVEGDWAVVNTGEASGYAALRFLRREAGPEWTALETPLTCLGTEPFWSLRVDPGQGVATLASPDDPEGQEARITQAWPGLPWAPTAAFALAVGTVVLSPADCSDGMSERRYGIAADLFLTRPTASRLSGCCTTGLR